MATMIVTENWCNKRPTIPPRKSTGINTATSERVIDTIVNPISFEASIAAS